MKKLVVQKTTHQIKSFLWEILGPRRKCRWGHPSWHPGVPMPGEARGAACVLCYLARPVTTVWAQGARISLKLPWSKNPLCQVPFRAVGRRQKPGLRGRVREDPWGPLERADCCGVSLRTA